MANNPSAASPLSKAGHSEIQLAAGQDALILPAIRPIHRPRDIAAAEQPQDLPPPKPLKKDNGKSDDPNAKPDEKGDENSKKETDSDAKKLVPDAALMGFDGKSPPPPSRFAKLCSECTRLYQWRMKKPVPTYPIPKEQHLTTMPDYVIQIPDILLVESPRSLPDQPIAGPHLVKADGKINMGLYGQVRVAGLTVEEAKKAIEDHLSKDIVGAQVNVDVYSYNSKKIYVIADGAGFGEQVFHLDFTGNETVLDVVAKVGGIPQQSSKRRIWVARPNPKDEKDSIILPVDWIGIVKCGQSATNYQLFPNDRLYIQSDPIQAWDGWIAKITSPIERLFGTNVLGGLMVYRYQNMGRQGFNTGTSTAIIAP